MENEIWLDIPEFEGYQVSDKGKVRTKNKITYTKRHGERHWKDRILKYKGKNYSPGYRVDLWKDGKPYSLLVARLVAFTFYNQNINNRKLTVDHLDGNRFNNDLKNLEIVSLKENIKRGYEKGLYHNQIEIKITNKKTNENNYFRSMSKASNYIGKYKNYISAMIKKAKFENENYKWEIR